MKFSLFTILVLAVLVGERLSFSIVLRSGKLVLADTPVTKNSLLARCYSLRELVLVNKDFFAPKNMAVAEMFGKLADQIKREMVTIANLAEGSIQIGVYQKVLDGMDMEKNKLIKDNPDAIVNLPATKDMKPIDLLLKQATILYTNIQLNIDLFAKKADLSTATLFQEQLKSLSETIKTIVALDESDSISVQVQTIELNKLVATIKDMIEQYKGIVDDNNKQKLMADANDLLQQVKDFEQTLIGDKKQLVEVTFKEIEALLQAVGQTPDEPSTIETLKIHLDYIKQSFQAIKAKINNLAFMALKSLRQDILVRLANLRALALQKEDKHADSEEFEEGIKNIIEAIKDVIEKVAALDEKSSPLGSYNSTADTLVTRLYNFLQINKEDTIGTPDASVLKHALKLRCLVDDNEAFFTNRHPIDVGTVTALQEIGTNLDRSLVKISKILGNDLQEGVQEGIVTSIGVELNTLVNDKHGHRMDDVDSCKSL